MDQTYLTQYYLQYEKESYRLLSLNEARKALKLSYATLRELINNGCIGTLKIRNRERIPMIQLKKFIDDNTIKKQKVSDLKLKTHTEKANFIIKKHTQ